MYHCHLCPFCWYSLSNLQRVASMLAIIAAQRCHDVLM